MYLKLKVTNFFKTVASPVTWSHISFVNIWTARIRGMVAVCFVIKTFMLIMHWVAKQVNQLFRAGHCYEGADNGQISISGLVEYKVNH